MDRPLALWPGLTKARARACGALLIGCAVVTGCSDVSKSTAGPSPLKCQVAATTSQSSLSAAGGTGTIEVSAPPECAWTAASNVNWVSSLSPSSGQGSGTVTFQVAPNPAAAVRQAEVTLNSERVVLVQSAAACQIEIAPRNHTFDAAGGSLTVTVTAPAGCSWSAASELSWLAIVGPASGNGSGSLRLDATANTSLARMGAATIGGQTLNVGQSGTTPAVQTCTYSLSPASRAASSSSGSGSIALDTGPGCPWSVQSGAPWLTISGASSGAGSATIAYAFEANAGAGRAGSLTIGTQIFTVTQSDGCAYSISQAVQAAPAAGGAGTPVAVTTAAGCSWAATSEASWLTITSNAFGIGSGTVVFAVAPNTGAPRTGTLAIANQTLTVNQAGTCASTIAPASQSAGLAATAGTPITVTAAAGCTWTAAANDAWLTIATGASGTGNGTVTFNIAANSGAPRTGTLTVAGQTFTVNQAGTCASTIAPASQSAGLAATAGTPITVTAAAGCTWTAAANDAWLTIATGASGTGNGTVTFNIAANSGAPRTGTLTVAGQTFTVNQAGTCATYTIAPASQSAGIPAAAGTPIAVTTAAGCTWTAAANDAWLTIATGATGTGNGTVTFSIAANPGPPRTGTLTIAGQTFTVNQAGTCTYVIAPPSQSAGTGASAGTPIAVTAAAVCSWTAASNDPWLTIATGASGSGNGTVTFNIAANSVGPRTGTLTVAGQTFTVFQAGTCSFSITPTHSPVNNSSQTGSVTLTATAGCAWTATSNATWLTITGFASGPGGTVSVNYSIDANTGPPRTGTLTIAGQTFTVDQSN